MVAVRIATGLVYSRQGYILALADSVTVGELARYLSQQEAYVETSTLELARPLDLTQRLQDVDVQAGDRIVMFISAAERAELAAALAPGDKIVKFRVGDNELSSRGKKVLLIGKQDDSRDSKVDVDLRNFVPPRSLGFISRETMRLDYESGSKTWYVTRTGRTRVLLNDFELGSQPAPLTDPSRLRFYRANDDPLRVRPIGEMRLVIETVEARDNLITLPDGSRRLPVQVGDERDSATINASANVPVGHIITGLITYHNVPRTPDVSLYLMRLIPPDTVLRSLTLKADEFLYSSRDFQFAQNRLILRDIHSEIVFELLAGPEDDDKLIGRRPEPDREDNALDVDLYDVIMNTSRSPNAYKRVSRHQAHVYYKASENTWWFVLEERTAVSVFINNTRASSSTPIQLTGGDVLSFGPSVENYYARLEVDIATRTD